MRLWRKIVMQMTDLKSNRLEYLAEIEFGDVLGLPFSDELWKHRHT